MFIIKELNFAMRHILGGGGGGEGNFAPLKVLNSKSYHTSVYQVVFKGLGIWC